MKTKDFLKKHSACTGGAKWALSIGEDMTAVWDAMIEHGKHEWLVWTATRLGVFPDAVLRKLACRFIRETPLSDSRKVWNLLTDERSRKAVEVAERYADGKAMKEDMDAAYAAAYAVDAAFHDAAARAADAAAYAASDDAAYAAAYAAYDAARAAYVAGRAAYVAACAACTAYAATYAADAAACAADAAACAADAAADAADARAKAAQVRMIADMGNPFK